MGFITITAPDSTTDLTPPSTKAFAIEHEVSRDRISAAGVKEGERYRVAFTNECLGTRWWMYGDLEDEAMKDVRFVRRIQLPKVSDEKEGTDEEGKWYKGEVAKELAFVIEGEDEGAVEFEIV